MRVIRSASGVRAAGVLAVSVMAAGCSTIPANGPTGANIRQDTRGSDNTIGYRIVDLDPQSVKTDGAPAAATSLLAPLATDSYVDTLGPGDVVSVQVYEVGAGLFDSGRTSLGEVQDATQPTARGSQLGSGLLVDRDGMISVPYVGRITVAGLTPAQVQDKILAGLKGKSQSPQVVVSLRENVANTVIVMGAVAKPGRMPLTLARDHLLDAIAEAGGIQIIGSSGSSTASGTGAQDVSVRFTRAGRTVVQPLDTIESGTPDDLLLVPGDRIELIRQPRTYTVFGAMDRIAQIPFESRIVSLAEALARAGGPSDSRADPRAIYVFRLAPPPPVAPGAPPPPPTAIVYHLDMMKASSYFTAQQFAMHDKDLIYVANAASNRPAKFVQILSQFFSPILTGYAVARR